MAYEILNPRSPRPILGVLLDMDGVILDSEKLYARFWAEACAAYGYPMTYTQALGMRSLNHEAGQAYLESLFGPEIRHSVIRAKRVELMDAFVEANGVAAKPGIGALLDYLEARQIPFAVTTSSPQDRVQSYLSRLGLWERFPHVCTSRQVAHGKPEPDIYLFGAKTLGLPPENCIALEDSYTGIRSAYRAGCRPVIIPDLDQPGEAIVSLAWAKADSLADIIPLLEAAPLHMEL